MRVLRRCERRVLAFDSGRGKKTSSRRGFHAAADEAVRLRSSHADNLSHRVKRLVRLLNLIADEEQTEVAAHDLFAV